MNQRGDTLIHREGDGHVAGRLEEGEGHVEPEQRLGQRLHCGVDGLVHAQNLGDGQAVGHGVGGVADIQVNGEAHGGHYHRPQKGAPQGAPAVLAELVKQPGRHHKGDAHQEVAQLPCAAGGGHGQVYQVLDKAHHHAADRPHGKGGDQGGQLGEVQLDKAGDDGQAEADEHQHGGHGA